jgi:hypothetical protein
VKCANWLLISSFHAIAVPLAGWRRPLDPQRARKIEEEGVHAYGSQEAFCRDSTSSYNAALVWGVIQWQVKMIGGNFFLSVLPKGLFSFAVEGGACGSNPLAMVLDDAGRKRFRDFGGSNTPTISPVSGFSCGDVRDDACNEDANDRPRKRLRGQSKTCNYVPVVTTSPKKQESQKQTSDLINKLPQDVVANCLSFLGSAQDRFALQTTCKLFRNLSNADSMLENVNVAGDPETGNGCIIQEHDTPASAAEALSPFARAGNLEAMYM